MTKLLPGEEIRQLMWLHTSSWAGSHRWRVEELSRGNKFARVRLAERTKLPTGWREAGEIVRVPVGALKVRSDSEGET